MKIAFGMIVFNGNYVLRECLESVYPYASQILIAEGPVTYWQEQGFTTSTDGTNEVISNFPDIENKIQVVHSQYEEKDDQCKAYMQFLNNDIDYLWNLDSDEIYKSDDIEKLIEILEKEEYTSVGFKAISFYGGFDHYLTGFEEKAEFRRVFKVFPDSSWLKHRPPTMKHKINVEEKHLNFNTLANKYGIRMYHYSYVFPEQVRQKVQYYKAAVSKDLCIDNYFENVYLPWVVGNDTVKNRIEGEYHGVHEFVLSYRGDCYTAKFGGEHPEIIQQNMGDLKRKFNEQIFKHRQIYMLV